MSRIILSCDILCTLFDCSLVNRARKTIRGSAEDIGWLQREPGMPPIEDGTKRYAELLDNIRWCFF